MREEEQGKHASNRRSDHQIWLFSREVESKNNVLVESLMFFA